MSYLTAVHTEPGLVKKINQDSLCVMEARTGVGEILMAVICDGMGGLAKGEVASASVAQALSEWFVKELPTQITNDNFWQEIKLRWQQLLLDENQKISRYGKARGVQLGTTATAILLLNDEKYLIAHVGDSRVYCLDNQGIRQITEDQTVTASEIKAGRLTPQEAETDPRKNVLLQCVGASPHMKPVMLEGGLQKGQIILLCSDGFRREISQEELFEQLRPEMSESEQSMKQNLVQLAEINKQRQEKDNISSILIHIV